VTQQVSPASVVRTTQIIIGALMSGLVCFGGVALTSQSSTQNNQSILTIVAAGLALMQIMMWFVIPGLIVKSQLKTMKDLSEADRMPRLAQTFQTQKIIGAALLEGAGFFNWVAYMIDHQAITLGVVGTLMVLLASMFPTQGQYESWVEEMKHEMSGP
jgi:uncharacterized membrane protein YbhN (UPF0104 family)